jgi:hypothetical protein
MGEVTVDEFLLHHDTRRFAHSLEIFTLLRKWSQVHRKSSSRASVAISLKESLI